MPVVSVSEFAQLTGKKPKDIHAYVSQKKVVKRDDKLIDTNNPVNALFLKKHGVVVAPVIEVRVPEALPPPMPDEGDGKLPGDLREEDGDLEYWKIEEKKRQVIRLDISIDKANAILIPTDLVKTYARYAKKVFIETFRSTFDRKIDLMILKYKLNSADAAQLRRETIDAINDAAELHDSEMKKSIKNIQAEYAEMRGVGERK